MNYLSKVQSIDKFDLTIERNGEEQKLQYVFE